MRTGVLHDVLKCLQHTEVHGALDLGRVALDSVGLDLDPYRGSSRHGEQRLGEALVGEQRRIDAVRQLPKLLECPVHLLLERTKAICALFWIASHQLLGELELDAERYEPLLGSVVEVALDATPFALRGRCDARARSPYSPRRRGCLEGELPVAEDNADNRHRGLDQPCIAAERIVVNHCREYVPAITYLRVAVPARGLGERRRMSQRVDPPACSVRRGKRDLDRRVAETRSARRCSARPAKSCQRKMPTRDASAMAGITKASDQAATSAGQVVG